MEERGIELPTLEKIDPKDITDFDFFSAHYLSIDLKEKYPDYELFNFAALYPPEDPEYLESEEYKAFNKGVKTVHEKSVFKEDYFILVFDEEKDIKMKYRYASKRTKGMKLWLRNHQK